MLLATKQTKGSVVFTQGFEDWTHLVPMLIDTVTINMEIFQLQSIYLSIILLREC